LSGADIAAALALTPQAISHIGRTPLREHDRDAYEAVLARMILTMGG
jgi:hypothetical protein